MFNDMKRILLAALCIAGAVLLAASCGNSTKKAERKANKRMKLKVSSLACMGAIPSSCKESKSVSCVKSLIGCNGISE